MIWSAVVRALDEQRSPLLFTERKEHPHPHRAPVWRVLNG